jgi:hypothetical protein
MHYLLFQKQSEGIVNQILPPEEEPIIDIDAALDTIVINVSQDLVNDIPAGDPRWTEMGLPGKCNDFVLLSEFLRFEVLKAVLNVTVLHQSCTSQCTPVGNAAGTSWAGPQGRSRQHGEERNLASSGTLE